MRLLLLFVLVIVGGGLVLFAANQECTIGVTGSAATITVHGANAATICNDWRMTTTTATYALMQGQATQPIVCQYVIERPWGSGLGEVTATVRDEGALKLVGAQLCQNLAKSALR